MRHSFATTRPDGAPVGSVLIAYSDGCVDGFLESGDVFTCSFSSDHERHHTPFLRAPFTYERFEDLTYVDDYDWDDWADDSDFTATSTSRP